MRAHRLLLSSAILLLSVVGVDAQTTGVREVSASERTLIPLTTKLRYTTMILLPEQEEILDVVCGDRDFWVISAAQHIAHVKPAKEGAATNLNLVTASGRVYSFLLTEQKGAAGPEGVCDRRSQRGHRAKEVLLRRRHVGPAGGGDERADRGRCRTSSERTRPSPASSASIRRRCSSSTP